MHQLSWSPSHPSAGRVIAAVVAALCLSVQPASAHSEAEVQRFAFHGEPGGTPVAAQTAYTARELTKCNF